MKQTILRSLLSLVIVALLGCAVTEAASRRPARNGRRTTTAANTFRPKADDFYYMTLSDEETSAMFRCFFGADGTFEAILVADVDPEIKYSGQIKNGKINFYITTPIDEIPDDYVFLPFQADGKMKGMSAEVDEYWMSRMPGGSATVTFTSEFD